VFEELLGGQVLVLSCSVLTWILPSLGSGETISFFEDEKVRIILLEGVKGETVTIDFESLRPDFDEVAPKAEKVLDTVEWTSSH
jgi:hypothetical protein